MAKYKHTKVPMNKCWHHDWQTGESYIKQFFINSGLDKLLWCSACGRSRVL